MKKKLISAVLIACMAVGLVACGSKKDDKGSAKQSSDTNVLLINLASEPDYLDPALNSSVDGGCLAVNTFVGLYTYGDDGKLKPALADGEAEVSEDGCTYTFKVKDSKWSNGEALTANDFVYSWNRAAADETAADYQYMFDIVDRNSDGKLAVEAKDDNTLVVKLTNPCPYFLDLLAFPTYLPVYQKDVEAANPNGDTPGAWAQQENFVCNGAYTLKEWKHEESMVYVKNPNFYDAKNVKIEELHFMLSADDTAIYAAYQDGSLDFIDTVPNDEIKSVQDSDEFRVVDQLGTYYVAFNVNSSIFEGKTAEQAAKMRQAISMLIDRNYIAENIGQTGQIPADSFVPAGMADGNGGIYKTKYVSYYDATKTGSDMKKEAVKLLEEAGYEMTENSDGTYKISPALSIEYLVNDGTGHQQIAEAIQQDLAEVGIEISIKTEEWNVFLDDRKNGNYDFAREGWVADYNDPINMLDLFESKSGNNDPQFGVNPKSYAPDWSEYDALIKELRTSTDMKARLEAAHKAEDMLMDTWAVIPIYFYNDIYMQKPNVDGIYSTVFGMKYFMYATKK